MGDDGDVVQPGAIKEAVAQYGADVKRKLNAVNVTGRPEDQLRAPLEALVSAVCGATGRNAAGLSLIGETDLDELSVRPDYAVELDDLLVGFIEIKAPGKGSDPRQFGPGHDREQWLKLRALPNIIYTDGQSFSLFRSGERYGASHAFAGDISQVGAGLASTAGFLQLFEDFFSWTPIAPETPAALAEVSARLCRLLRDEVREKIYYSNQKLTDLRDDWKALLFPEASDEQFADWYAQSVTFGLLLARARGITLDDGVEQAARALSLNTKSLIGSALRILVDSPDLEQTLQTSVSTMGRVLAVVDWERVSQGNPDAWLYFYEGFLQIYDTDLRKKTGSYYTPPQVTAAMVRLVGEALDQQLDIGGGFADPAVTVLDPAFMRNFGVSRDTGACKGSGSRALSETAA